MPAIYTANPYLRRRTYNELHKLVIKEWELWYTPFMFSCRRMRQYVEAKAAIVSLMKLYGWNNKEICLLTGMPRGADVLIQTRKSDEFLKKEDYRKKYEEVDKKFMEVLKKIDSVDVFS